MNAAAMCFDQRASYGEADTGAGCGGVQAVGTALEPIPYCFLEALWDTGAVVMDPDRNPTVMSTTAIRTAHSASELPDVGRYDEELIRPRRNTECSQEPC